MTDVIQIVTTASSRSEAETIARGLIDQRLAACVQVAGPISSTYWWEGKIESSEEWLCTAKTRNELYSRAEQEIRHLHSYDEPEILATEVVRGSAGYVNWLRRETQGETGSNE